MAITLHPINTVTAHRVRVSDRRKAMEEKRISLQDFIASQGITADAAYADRNPNMIDDGARMDHWRVTLRKPGRKMTVYFSMGAGLNGKAPVVGDVLDCLASDAAGVENAQSFEDWCGDYGYNTDSRKALKTFNVCKRQAERLRNFIGDGYETLLWQTDRL